MLLKYMAKKSITKNYIYNMVYQVLILILPLITTPYLSRVLGAEGIGIYSYTYAIVTYFILFGSLGVALYGQREIAYAQDNPSKRKQIFLEIAIFRIITISIATVFYYFLFVNGKEYQLYYKILILELIAAAFDISWFFQGIEEFKKTVTRNVLVRICSVSLVFVLVKNSEDLAKFTLIYSIADLIGNLSLWIYLPKYLKGIKVTNLNIKRHLPHIVMLFIPQIANQIYNILDTTMIGWLVDDKSETGFYEQGHKVIRLLLTIVNSLGVVMIPRMANAFANNDKKQIHSYMRMSFNFTFFLSFPIMFGIISISREFVPIFFGEGYDKVNYIIYVLSPMILLMGIANVLGTQYLLPTKRQKEYTSSVTIGLIINFILNYILINLYHSIGAAIATVISQLIVDSLQYRHVKDEISLKSLFKMASKYLFSAIIMFIMCFMVRLMLSTNIITQAIYNLANNLNMSTLYVFNILSIFIQILAGVITYIGILIGIKDPYIFSFINKIKNRFLKRKIVNE